MKAKLNATLEEMEKQTQEEMVEKVGKMYTDYKKDTSRSMKKWKKEMRK